MKNLILVVLYLAVASGFAQEPEGVFLMPPYYRGVDSSKMVLIRDRVFGAFANTKLYNVVDLSSLKNVKIDLTAFYEQGKISQEVKIKLENLNCIYVLGTILSKDTDEGKIVISVKMQHISTLQLVPGKTAVGYTDYNLTSIDAACRQIILELFGSESENTFTDPRDGKGYKTVKIGSQTWMAENLNYGQRISPETQASDNGVVEKYCYNDNPDNCREYGGLYDWNEMMGYSTIEGAQGICPQGWHIPSKGEWCKLLTFLDSKADCLEWEVSHYAGGKLKESGINHWISSNFGVATNESGFTALGAGYGYSGGSFGYLKSFAYFWSSTELSSTHAYYYNLNYNNATANRSNANKAYRYSLRCLRD